MSLPSDPQPAFPRPEPASGFPRWRFFGWLWLYVEDTLARLPLLLLVPVLGAVIGTAVAVSEIATVRIDGKLAAAPPSLWDVLWPALAGGASGILLIGSAVAVWGHIAYFRRGDDTWEIVLVSPTGGLVPGMLALVCKGDVPSDPNQLGAMECVVRHPSGEFDRSDMFAHRPGRPYGVLATGVGPLTAPGAYEIRWYATEHRGKRLHEVARKTHTV